MKRAVAAVSSLGVSNVPLAVDCVMSHEKGTEISFLKIGILWGGLRGFFILLELDFNFILNLVCKELIEFQKG